MDTLVEGQISALRDIAGKRNSENEALVLEGLADGSSQVRQWAIVATIGLRKREAVKERLLDLSNNDQLRDVQAYAHCYYAKLGGEVTIKAVAKFLSEDPTARQSAIVLKAFSTGRPTDEKIDFLVRQVAAHPDPEFHTLLELNALRIVRRGLVEGTISKEKLKRNHAQLYAKTEERRFEKAVEEGQEELRQKGFFDDADDEDFVADSYETPGRTQDEIEEAAYVDDMIQIESRYREKKVYTRNYHLAKQLRKLRGEVCQVCGIENIRMNVHHVQPLEDGGADEHANMLVVCPNCHTRFHHGQVTRTATDRYALKLDHSNTIQLDGLKATSERFKVMNDYFHHEMC